MRNKRNTPACDLPASVIIKSLSPPYAHRIPNSSIFILLPKSPPKNALFNPQKKYLKNFKKTLDIFKHRAIIQKLSGTDANNQTPGGIAQLGEQITSKATRI